MKDNKEGKDTGHDYDGIRELDNKLPTWWVWSFYITIIFSIVYYGYYQLGSGQTIDQEFKEEMAKVEQLQKASGGGAGGFDTAKLNAYAKDSGALEKGKAVYMTRCASCHAPQGGGLIGPNLTDNAWISGDGTLPAIAKVIAEGVPAKGMPPWGPVITPDELLQVTAYIKSLKGTNPAGAKPPQGTVYNN